MFAGVSVTTIILVLSKNFNFSVGLGGFYTLPCVLSIQAYILEEHVLRFKA